MPSPVRLGAMTALIALASWHTVAAAPQSTSPIPPAIRYAIDVSLQPGSYRLDGTTEITWVRRDRPVRDLRLQMFLNAWRNPQSTWMRAYLAHASAPSFMRWGGIDVTAISMQTAAGSSDLSRSTRFVAPDGNDTDLTVLHVDLPQAVAADEAITIRLQWTAAVPSFVGETGARGRYFFFGHWSPVICAIDADGWQCPQAHPSDLAPAEAADYDVRIAVPSGWTVGSTGGAPVVSRGGDRVTYAFKQTAVRSFAWTASPDFTDTTIRVTKDAPVDVRLLVQPEHQSQVSRIVEAVEESLAQYVEFTPYPYDHLTIVDAAWHTHDGGGAYPALVTVAGRWLTPKASIGTDADVARGLARLWWGETIAIDPAHDAVTDRAIADYVHVNVVRALSHRHGLGDAYSVFQPRYFGGFVQWAPSRVRFDGPAEGLNLPLYRARPTADAPSTMRLVDAGMLSAIRARAAIAFATLERYLGWPAMHRALATSAGKFAFQTVRRADLFQTMSSAVGQDLSWFFGQTFDRSDVFDYAVSVLTTEPQPSDECRSSPCFRTSVVVRRLGEAEFTGTSQEPIGPYQSGRALKLRVKFADGSEITDRWDGRARWRLFEYESRSQAVSAEIDPDEVLLLDVNRANNSITREPKARAAAVRWAAHWGLWLQDLLLTYAALV